VGNPGVVARRLPALPDCLDGLPGRSHLQHGVPIVQPPGGHAIYLDAKLFCRTFRSISFRRRSCHGVVFEGGIRSVEIGSLMFAAAAQMELVRLAIPRRVYTQSHIDYVVEIILQVFARRAQIKGMRLTYEAPFLRHFTAHLEPMP